MYSPGCHGHLLPFSHPLPLSCCPQLSTYTPRPRAGNHRLGSSSCSAPAQPCDSPGISSGSAEQCSENNKLTLQRCFSRVFIQCQSEEQNSVQTTPQCLTHCCTEPQVESSQLWGEGEAIPLLCDWTKQDVEPVCTHTKESLLS